MDQFKIIGYDIRVGHEPVIFSADCSVWDCDDSLIQSAIGDIGLEKNYYQLLQPKNFNEFKSLYSLVTKNNSFLLQISILEKDFNMFKNKYGDIGHVYNDKESMSLGLDVCDMNGFFSALNMDLNELDRENLFDLEELNLALRYRKVVEKLVPEHSPFTIALLKKRFI